MTSTSTRSLARGAGWRIAGITATVAVIASGITIGPAVAWTYMQEIDTTTEQSAATFDRVPKAVGIDADTADVTLTTADSDQVAVERTVEWAKTKPTIDEAWSREALNVDLKCPGDITDWFNDVCRIDYGMQLPERTPVDVSMTTGDIALDGALGDSDATTTTGDITVDGALGDADMTTTTGDIIGMALAASTTSAHATTGDIELDYANPPDEVTASVSTGDISITVPDDGEAYRVVGETETGERDIRVATDPSAERVIEVNSTTGGVDIGYRK